MIEFQNISKNYKITKREAGFHNAVKSFFSRQYELVPALSDVSFSIPDGEMVGYIGPNGAGKSTTIKIMCGVLTPDHGKCIINGRIPYKNRVDHVREIGVVFGQRSQLWWDVPVNESFQLIRDIYDVEEKQYKRTLVDLVELLDLGEIIKTPARNLSLGQRMRCEIAASLLHSPKILFLDEPTIGLDAVSKIAVRKFIKQLNKEHHTTVILTTHDMQDIEELTERILLIGKGRILLDGSLQELKKHTSLDKQITINYKGELPLLREGLYIVKQTDGEAVIALDQQELTTTDAIAYLASKVDLVDLSVSGPSMEQIIANLYKEYQI